MKGLAQIFNVSVLFRLSTLSFVIADCPPRTYGANCSFVCSSECLDGLCDHVTGNCSLCGQGYHGHDCETGKRGSYSPNYWPVAVGLVISLVILAVVFWRCRKMVVEHKRSAFRPAPSSDWEREGCNSSADQLSSPAADRRPTLRKTGSIDKSLDTGTPLSNATVL
ncbi:receptor-type tyrosine-protein phosphatase U [Elysia marginata]|uniref:Receptor-type tyrosine-protein phosphatase U n=1 Tax=Elysia marginata TaxID=1093978 RepID=A0AAV4HZZ8_9GAST|nr:receptor-type tyrosine-protein phosphatase U [Elysia marginata]